MTVRDYCVHPHCWLHNGHHGGHRPTDPPFPLTCTCMLSQPDAIDECVRCHRVVAERVHERRMRRLYKPAPDAEFQRAADYFFRERA